MNRYAREDRERMALPRPSTDQSEGPDDAVSSQRARRHSARRHSAQQIRRRGADKE